MSNLAQALRSDGQTSKAIPIFEEVVALRRANLPPDHPDTARSVTTLADAYLEVKRWDSAEPLLRNALRLHEESRPDDWQRFHVTSLLGAALTGLGKNDEAEPLLIGGYDGMFSRRDKIPATRTKDLTAALKRIADYYDAVGKPNTAITWRARLATVAKGGPQP